MSVFLKFQLIFQTILFCFVWILLVHPSVLFVAAIVLPLLSVYQPFLLLLFSLLSYILLSLVACSGTGDFHYSNFSHEPFCFTNILFGFPWLSRLLSTLILPVFLVGLLGFHPLIQFSSTLLRSMHFMMFSASFRCQANWTLSNMHDYHKRNTAAGAWREGWKYWAEWCESDFCMASLAWTIHYSAVQKR